MKPSTLFVALIFLTWLNAPVLRLETIIYLWLTVILTVSLGKVLIRNI
jgi:hypothetical protein